MKTFNTENSVYEYDEDNSRVRRVFGDNPPHSSFGADGQWREVSAVKEFDSRLLIYLDDGKVVVTSPLVSA